MTVWKEIQMNHCEITVSTLETELYTNNIEIHLRFSTLCDFQFLPLHNDVKNDKLVNMLPCLGIKDNKFNESIFTQDAPLFLPPATFSRIDTMQDSLFKKDVKPRSVVSYKDNCLLIEKHIQCNWYISSYTSIFARIVTHLIET